MYYMQNNLVGWVIKEFLYKNFIGMTLETMAMENLGPVAMDFIASITGK